MRQPKGEELAKLQELRITAQLAEKRYMAVKAQLDLEVEELRGMCQAPPHAVLHVSNDGATWSERDGKPISG